MISKNHTGPWEAKELRLTPTQADFLATQHSSVHQRVTDRTELILSARGMLRWVAGRNGEFHLANSAKGDAALARYHEGSRRRLARR